MNYNEYVAYFKRLENLEKIKRTNGPSPPLPVDNKKNIATSSVGVAVGKKKSKMWCHYCDESNHNKQRPNSVKTVILRPKLIPERSPWPFFSKKSIR